MVEESVSCDLCGSYDHSTVECDVPCNVVKCNNCGLVFMNPRPPSSKVRSYYEDEYSEKQLGAKEPPEEYILQAEKKDKRRLNFITNNSIILKNKEILDIGCGCGTFPKLLEEQEAIVLGIEPNKDFAEYANTKLNGNVLNKHFDDFEINKKFNIICLWQVLNLTLNPSFLIAKIKRLLKKNGTLFIEVPNYFDSPKLSWKEKLRSSDPGQFFYFTENTIKKMLEKHDMSISKCRYVDNKRFMIISVKHSP